MSSVGHKRKAAETDSWIDEDELDDEAKIRYDRQIRVWGAEAQKRIQTSKVFVCGLDGLHVELVKNIVLAGMHLTVHDSNVLLNDHLAYNFFATINDLGKNIATSALSKIQDLNSFSEINAETRHFDELDDQYFDKYRVILLSDMYSTEQAIRINNICRKSTPPKIFFWSGAFGKEAWFISDFGDKFDYMEDPSQQTSIRETKTISFPSLQTILDKRWKEIPSRHFPLSKTFVKSRVLSTFIDRYQYVPHENDVGHLQELYWELANYNEMEGSHIESFIGKSEWLRFSHESKEPCILTCSILGSFLAQEVIKAVSQTGEPGKNLFLFTSDDCVVKCVPVE